MARLGRLKKPVVGPKGDRELIYVRVQLNNVFITENWFVVSTWIQLSDVFITQDWFIRGYSSDVLLQ